MSLDVDLTGRTILVCGVQRGGIGGSTVRQIVRAGGAVVALDHDQAIIDPTIADVKELGGRIDSLVADLYDIDACQKVIATVIDRFGMIDGIANVAGGTRADEWGPLDQTPTASFQASMQLNFGYVFFLCRDLAHAWIESGRGGAIVNVSSISSLASAPWHGPYGAAKSAITALTRTMANEWHELGIRANAVLPGAVWTERVMSRAPVANVKDTGMNFTMPDELANTIAFLLCDLAAGISGQALTVDRSLTTKFCGGARLPRKAGQGRT
ncbi:MAG: SDR family oxidoreductase [Novosphingobium sp.]|jgi:NAD(P)-dependent dehydrogenase (short-subunit alcohol dehydrogenase family)|nr:SDR family oxidoreductase [Novosphingobium sp.]